MRIEFDDPRLFEKGRDVVVTLAGKRMVSSIEELRHQHGRQVLKLRGIDSISEAEEWIGAQVSIDREALPEPEEGSYFDFQLVGCQVYEDDIFIGRVAEVVDYAGTLLLRVDHDGHEVLIPFVGDLLERIDLEEERIDVVLPDGLLDLNRR